MHIRDLFVPDSLVLADNAMPFVKKIRAGFILAADRHGPRPHSRLHRHHDSCCAGRSVTSIASSISSPKDFEEMLADCEREVMTLAATPYDTSAAYWERVIKIRLRIGEASRRPAHAAMLHCGARGYLTSHRAQRRLREAYFVAIVTPATKQLKMLAEGAQ